MCLCFLLFWKDIVTCSTTTTNKKTIKSAKCQHTQTEMENLYLYSHHFLCSESHCDVAVYAFTFRREKNGRKFSRISTNLKRQPWTCPFYRWWLNAYTRHHFAWKFADCVMALQWMNAKISTIKFCFLRATEEATLLKGQRVRIESNWFFRRSLFRYT